MKIKRIILYINIVFLSSQCAQITPLGGGKKDSTPPKAILYEPQNASVNFNGKEINIEFDEYITLKDISNQFIITPQTNELPDINVVGKKLKIKFTEPLLPNTTYKLFFGNSIADTKEFNPLQNFEYVFSTGNKIDSLILKGKLISANNNKPTQQALVGLYLNTSKDSVIYKLKPLYISRTNNDGDFVFSYLPNSLFKIIAIKDENKNLMYDGSSEEIAFKEKNINTLDTLPIILKLFKEKPSKQFIKKIITPEYGKAIVVYNKPCLDLTTVTSENNQGYYQVNDKQDSITIYYKDTFDTLKTIINRYTKNDTLAIKIPSKLDFEKMKKNGLLKYHVKTNFNGSFHYYENLEFNLNFPVDLDKIYSDKIFLYELKDTLKLKKEFKIIDNEKKYNSYIVKTNLNEETQYLMTFDKGAFKDASGRMNDSLSYRFKTTSNEDYGKLNLKLIFPKKENYLIYLLNENGEKIKTNTIELSLTSSSNQIIAFENLLPGNYFIKIVEDANKNNAFDTGDYFLKQQPEKIYYSNLPIKILAGWEIENEWLVK